jgi:hypothetical protein
MLVESWNLVPQRGLQPVLGGQGLGCQRRRRVQRSIGTSRSHGSQAEGAGPDRAGLASAEQGADQSGSSLQGAGGASRAPPSETTPGSASGSNSSSDGSSSSSVLEREAAGGSVLQQKEVQEMLMFAVPALGESMW